MWASRLWLWLFRVTLGGTIWTLIEKAWAAVTGLVAVVFMKTKPDLMQEAVKLVNDEVVSFTPLAVTLSADTIQQITGVAVDPGTLSGIAGAIPGRDQMMGVGDAFLPVLNQMFDLNAARQDFETRTGFAGSVGNMSAYFGTNLLFQLRSLTISTISSMFGFASLRHLEGLHQTINWSFGFGWLSWTIMSKVMETAVLPGVSRFYNSQVKPHDLTASEAIDAWIRGWLAPEEMQKVLDNEGIMTLARDPKFNMNYRWFTVSESIDLALRGYRGLDEYHTDMQHQAVRPEQQDVLLDLNETAFPDGDVQAFYQHGRMNEDDVLSHFRHKGYRQQRATLERDSIVEARTWELLGKVTDSYGRLYRDEVVGEGEYRQFLDSQGWTPNEQDLQIAYLELERRQRTFLSNADLGDAVDQGILTTSDMFDELTARGYTPEDATVVIILQLQKHLPACDKEKVKQDALIAFLQGIGAQAGVNPALLRPQVLRYLQCLNELVPLILPIAHIKATPAIVNGTAVIELEWSTEFATSAKITPTLGAVPLSGKTQINLTASKSYTITATNPLGSTTAFAFIPFQGLTIPTVPGAEPAPVIQFAADTTQIIEGAQVTLSWNVTGADSVTIDKGVGKVPLAGSLRVSPSEDTLYALTATSPGPKPTTAVSFVQVSVEPLTTPSKPPAPVVRFVADKSVIDDGDTVFLTWDVSGAERVSVDHGVGSVPTVGGQRVTPSTDTTYALTATIQGVSTQAFVFVRVNAVAKPEKVPPPPPPSVSIAISQVQINEGESTSLSWSSVGADTVQISRGVGNVPINGSVAVSPTTTGWYAATARNRGGSTNAFVLVTVIPKPPKQPAPTPPPPPRVRFTAGKSVINQGEEVLLMWETEGAASVRISPLVGAVPLSGTFLVTPSRTTIFALSASNSPLEAGPTETSQGFVTVTVIPKPKA